MITQQDPSQGPPQTTAEESAAPTCCHHWIIETADGPISRGVCRLCFETRDFRNSVVDLDREVQDLSPRGGPGAPETVAAQEI